MNRCTFFQTTAAARALTFALLVTSAFAADSPWPAPVPGFVAPKTGEHPRLFFRRADLPELKRRAQTAEGNVIVERLRFLLNGSDGGTLPELFNPTRSDKEGSGDFHKSASDGKAFTLWHGAGYGMLFQLTGEKKYADLGRQCAEKMLEGQRDRDDRYAFVGPHGALRAGPSLGAMAMAYDLCHDGWDADFRKRVALEIQNYNQGPNESLPNLAQGKRHGPASNHWGPHIGGGALAILAILGDEGTDEAKLRPLLNANAKCIVRNLTEGFGDGGYFHEHAGPGQIASDTAFIPALQAWRVAGGQDFISPRPNAPAVTLIRSYELLRGAKETAYLLRHPSSYGSGKYPDDRNGLSRGGQFAQGFGAVRDEQKPALLWTYHFVEPDAARRTYDKVSPYPHRAVLALMNWPIGVPEKNPADVLPRVHLDSLKHYVVFRNRWQDAEDIIITGLWGARADGREALLVWGLGERIEWGQCPKSSSSRVTGMRPDGSGVFTAQAVSLAVDFSKTSGADALIVWTGPGAGGTARGGGGKVKTQRVTIGERIYDVFTLSAKGEHPVAKADGESVTIGTQRVSFKDGGLILGAL